MRVTRSTFSKYLRINVFLLRIFGLLPLSTKSECLAKVTSFFSVFIVSVLMLGPILSPNFYSIVNESSDVKLVMEICTYLTQSCGLQLKYLVLLVRRTELNRLIESCQDLWDTDHPRGYDILLRHVKRGFAVTCTFVGTFVLTLGSFTVIPLVLRPENATQSLPVSPTVVITSELWFKIAYAAQCVSTFICGALLTAVDSIFPVLIVTSCGQFELMRAEISDNDRDYKKSSDTDQNVHSTFSDKRKRFIVRHQRVIAHYFAIEENFNVYCLLQMLIGFTTIALGCLILSMGTSDPLKYLMYLVSGIVQIFVCNWPPARVIEESHNTSLAVYDLSWYREAKFRTRTTVSLLIMFTQRPIRLTAGKVMNLSIETFSKILTNALSFFTVLKTFT